MNADTLKAFCHSLTHTLHVVQWGGSDVFKVGKDGKGQNKVFAVLGWQKDTDGFGVSFKTSDIGFEILSDTPGCRPAPYLASRGMKWIQCYNLDGMDQSDLEEHIAYSHTLVARNLTKKLRAELGIEG